MSLKSRLVTGRICRHFTCVVSIASIVACTDLTPSPVSPPASTTQSTAQLDTTLGLPQAIRPEERLFAELATEAPSSAGFYYDSAGALVLQVRDLVDDAAARRKAQQFATTRQLVRSGGGRDNRTVRIRRARFTFRQLAEWRDLAFDHVLGQIAGVYALDLNEAQNRVVFGVDQASEASVIGRVHQTLQKLGVDPAALSFERSGPLVFDNLTAPPDLTSESADLLAGGMQINVRRQGATSASVCTMGFAAIRDNVPGLVSNSHCTTQVFNPDADSVYQLSTARHVATAAVDPNAYQCGFNRCRGADAAFFSATSLLPMGVGLIARTTYSNNGGWNGGNGSVNTNTNAPYWYVTAEENDNLVLGTRVEKLGSITGWTYGYIDNTCSDLWIDGISKMRCAYRSEYHSEGGDSGGPVFIISDQAASRVTLAGIHSGHVDAGINHSYFAKLSRIKSDLGGTWTVVHPSPPPPSPTPYNTTLTHSGGFDQLLTEPGSYTFTATTQGGGGSYSYRWSILYYDEFIDYGETSNVLTLSFMCPQYYDSVTVRVSVTDANGVAVGDATTFAVDTRQSPGCQ